MPLHVGPKRGKPGLWISGTVANVRVRRRAASDKPALAREEAAIIEAELLRSAWHGKRPGLHTFGQAVVSYIEHQPRADSEKRRINRLLLAVGDVALHSIDQELVDKLRGTMLRADPSPATVTREIIAPLRAIMTHASRRKWCDVPAFDIPEAPKGRTAFLLPGQVEALRAAAAPHLRPLITFLIGTGARLGETLSLDWSDVDLSGARARFWPDQTKAGISYTKALPPAVIAALASLPHRDGAVFRTPTGEPYADREGGGHIRTAWHTACTAAKVEATGAHTLRHSWASWHYAIHRDLLRLKADGGWSSVTLVERYAHLMPEGHEAGIRRVWGLGVVAGSAVA